jgi:hypothetical protein
MVAGDIAFVTSCNELGRMLSRRAENATGEPSDAVGGVTTPRPTEGRGRDLPANTRSAE